MRRLLWVPSLGSRKKFARQWWGEGQSKNPLVRSPFGEAPEGVHTRRMLAQWIADANERSFASDILVGCIGMAFGGLAVARAVKYRQTGILGEARIGLAQFAQDEMGPFA